MPPLPFASIRLGRADHSRPADTQLRSSNRLPDTASAALSSAASCSEVGVTGSDRRFSSTRACAPVCRPTVRALRADRRRPEGRRGPSPPGPVLVFIAATGLRRAEALALAWEHVDLKDGSLKVAATLSRVGGELVITEPKPPRSRRTVPLSPAVVAMLRAHRATQLAERLYAGNQWTDSGLVFKREFGGPVDPRNLLQSRSGERRRPHPATQRRGRSARGWRSHQSGR
jgi:hypothetical protein